MTRGGALGLVALLAACAATGLGAPPGQPALAPADEAELKTLALQGMRQELQREGADGPGRLLIFLDTLVGPTPSEYVYDWVHRPEWLAAVRAAGLVDELYGPPSARDRLIDRSIVLEVGAPFPSGRDSMGIIYDWCIRRLPARDGTPGIRLRAWRDTFVRSDTGWQRVRHMPAVAPTGCSG